MLLISLYRDYARPPLGRNTRKAIFSQSRNGLKRESPLCRRGGFFGYMKLSHILTLGFLSKQPIDEQIDRYVRNKSLRSKFVANNHREWLMILKNITGKNSVFKMTQRDFVYYLKWVEEEYLTEHTRKQAKDALQQFLKFYRVIEWETSLD